MSQIQIMDDFLTNEQVIEYRTLVDSYGLFSSIICNRDDIIDAFSITHKEKLESVFGITRVTPYMTVSRGLRNLDWHYDRSLDGDTHKLLIYLDDVAGTLFRLQDEKQQIYHIEPKAGRAVLFPFSLEHKGEEITGTREKYTIGFRVVALRATTC